MALPLFIKILPLLKVLALGSIKFVGIGIGAAIAPVLTANFLVGLSAGTPLKYARFRHSKGLFTEEQINVIEQADQLVQDSISQKEAHLSRAEAREFLKEVLKGTALGMKRSVLSLPAAFTRLGKQLIAGMRKLFSAAGK